MNRSRFVMMSVVLVSMALAGCTSGGAELYSYSSGGSSPADVDDSFDVDSGKARVSVSGGGAGSAQITIRDAAGDSVYNQGFGTGGTATDRTVSGAAGTWTIEIDFQNWQGGFALSIVAA